MEYTRNPASARAGMFWRQWSAFTNLRATEIGVMSPVGNPETSGSTSPFFSGMRCFRTSPRTPIPKVGA